MRICCGCAATDAGKIAEAILAKAKQHGAQEPGSHGRDPRASGHEEAKLLFSLAINIAGNHTQAVLSVRDGDVPKELAATFAVQYKLDSAAEEKIAQVGWLCTFTIGYTRRLSS
jgi:hypothetical protein